MDICTAHTFFNRVIGSQVRPLLGISMELTRRCNLRCKHCYCVQEPASRQGRPELSATHWQDILRQCQALGVFEITVTGGEPLLHPDFFTVWKDIKLFGFLPTLFTNGTLVDQQAADFLAQHTPLMASISLYGACEQTYQLVTGRSGMFQKAIDGIEAMVRAGITVEVKGVFNKLNWHEYKAVKALALEYCQEFRWDVELMGAFPQCRNSPQEQRIDIREYIQQEQQDQNRMIFLKGETPTWQPAEEAPGCVFRCGVGRKTAHIDPYGYLHPCLPLESLKYDLLSGSLQEGWVRAVPEMLQTIPYAQSPCQTCEAVELCRFCPAFAMLEGCAPSGPIEYKCHLARERAEAYGIITQIEKASTEFWEARY